MKRAKDKEPFEKMTLAQFVDNIEDVNKVEMILEATTQTMVAPSPLK